jgi:acetylglutamate kinase
VIDVDTAILRDVLATGRLPVVTPLALDAHGNLLNVNADTAAVAIALALAADKLVFLSGVPGVLNDNRLVETLTRAKSEALRADGVLCDGMVPKVEAALRAHAGGVAEVRIKGLREQTSESGLFNSSGATAAPLFTEGTLIA